MSTALIISLTLAVAVFILINVFFEVKFFKGFLTAILNRFGKTLDKIGEYNTKKYIERKKKQSILKPKEGIISKYNNLVEGLINDFKLPLTLESFTSLLCIAFAIVVMIIVIFMKNVTLSIVIGCAAFIGIMTAFVMTSKAVSSEKLESIMDAEDIICPLAREGVLNAIKKVMESDEYIHKSIRPYFRQFISNCEDNGYSFRQAITLLNKQLGHKFDNFTKKAITFEYNERIGMADIFLDIVDENAVLREMNAKKDRIFKKMNKDFLIKTVIIVLFFCYALTIPEFKTFMIDTDAGRFIKTIIISTICLCFARCQALQSDLGIGGE